MSVGDFLEWLAIAAFTVAAFLWSGTVLALGVLGAGLAYEAQCYSGTRFGRREQ
jgi:hypothetical protein